MRSGGGTFIQLPLFDYLIWLWSDLPEMLKLSLASFTATVCMISIGQPLEILITRIYNE